jgi:3-hydroxybutyryl-CoA dehydrogenase
VFIETKGRLGRVEIRRVVVVGAGQMGAGIAQVVAASGREVALFDAQPGAVDRALETMRRSLDRLAEKGGPPPEEALQRVRPVARVADAGEVELLIEAVVEDAAVKAEVLREADRVLPAQAILASNTSSIPIGSLAAVTSRPERVIGMHFFNPVPVLKLVEVIRATETADETAAAVVALARELGKEPVEVRDVAGFVSNRILMPFINEAVHALAAGIAEAAGIDTVAKLGFGHPLGPLALADLIGLDTCVAIMEVLQEGLGDPRFEPAPLLREHVAAGRLGRKSGRGFFSYGE